MGQRVGSSRLIMGHRHLQLNRLWATRMPGIQRNKVGDIHPCQVAILFKTRAATRHKFFSPVINKACHTLKYPLRWVEAIRNIQGSLNNER